MTAALASAPWAFLLRALIEPSTNKKVHCEPVVFYLMQTVQNRTKWPKNAQVKIGARALYEPDAGKRVRIEPPASKKVHCEPLAQGSAYFFRVEKKSNLLLLKLTLYY